MRLLCEYDFLEIITTIKSFIFNALNALRYANSNQLTILHWVSANCFESLWKNKLLNSTKPFLGYKLLVLINIRKSYFLQIMTVVKCVFTNFVYIGVISKHNSLQILTVFESVLFNLLNTRWNMKHFYVSVVKALLSYYLQLFWKCNFFQTSTSIKWLVTYLLETWLIVKRYFK